MYENKILDAIQMLVDDAINKAEFDKTIKGVISKCVDEKNGKYVVIYQDSSFYAYSNDTSQIYSAGTPVYILVPKNDMTQTKTIVGSVNKLGSDYINTVENTNRYETIGNTIASIDSEQGVCSYASGGDIFILYDKRAENSIATIDTIAANTYIKQAKYLIIGGKFRTQLNKEQRYKGIYGLGFDLNFNDNMTNEIVKRTYLVDVNNMLGNPYEYKKDSEQKIVFNIDGINFVDIDKIYLFCYDFPNTSETITTKDIFVNDIILEAATALTDSEIAGNKLTLITPQGIYFDDNDNSTSKRKIETEIKVDNKVVNKDSSLLKYYWFKENYSINSSSLLYNRYGGNGWECLNNYNIVEKDENNNIILIDWITNQSNYFILKSDIIAKTTDYKCVVVYNNEIVFTKQLTIYNYSSSYDVSIESDSGVYFSYDNGHPTLTCSVNQDDSYTYSWGIIDSGNNFSSLSETEQDNDTYHTALNRYNEIQSGLANGSILLTSILQAELTQLRNTLYQYKTKMRIEDNVIYNLKLNMITNFATFVCMVYKNNTYIGKGKIKIENDWNTSDNSYTLIINNGNQIFKYDENGISPASKSLSNPQDIYPLSFTLFDEKGNEINNDSIDAKNIYWTVPSENSMIEVSSVHGNPYSVDDLEKTKTYREYKQLYFNIPLLYNAKNIRNTVELEIKYKNKNIKTKVEIIFLKEGESGTNGTSYYCRIVPNNTTISPSVIPTITYNTLTSSYSLNYTPRTSNVWFTTQLYRNGEKIFDSATSGSSTENKTVTIKWEMLKNKYDATHSDVSNFNVNSNTGVFGYSDLSSITDSILKGSPANIVKCTITYDGITYTCTKPIVLVKVHNTSDISYRAEIVEDTGFDHAVYTSDGRTPQYSNSLPFELKTYQTIGGIEEEISVSTELDDYDWSEFGAIWNGTEWTRQINLIKKNYFYRELRKNEIYYKPIDIYNGLTVNNGIKGVVSKNGDTLIEVYIPIHLYLNKYGKSALNGWDGNSIEINNDGGFILTPQIGAGKKENDNSYTGLFMGTTKDSSNNEKTGLFGYNAGAQTIFLDAETGKTELGKTGQGKIVIDPGAQDAKIYSDTYNINYVLPNNMNPPQTKYQGGYSYWKKNGDVYTLLKVHEGSGNPGTNEYNIGDTIGSNIYVWANGSGMEIDLNDPHIRFGSGRFRVDSDGQVYAVGFATIKELEEGDYNIPGINIFNVDYTNDTVQFEANAQLHPIGSGLIEKTIQCNCTYRDEITTNYNVKLLDSNNNEISNYPYPSANTYDSNGLRINITQPSSNPSNQAVITFIADSNQAITSTVNSYKFKFSHPSSPDTIVVNKLFYANLVVKGTSVTIKGGPYASVTALCVAHSLGNTLGDAYTVGETNAHLYVFTNGNNTGGAQPGDWSDVGQIQGAPGKDAKQIYISSTADIFKKDKNMSSYNPSSITLTPFFQNTTFNKWSYSIDGGSSFTDLDLSSLPTGITFNSNTKAITITNDCSLYSSSISVLTFKCIVAETHLLDGVTEPYYDIISIGRVTDGTDGLNGKTIWITSDAPVYQNNKYIMNIADLVGPNKAPEVGEIIIYNNRYQYPITTVNTLTVEATNRYDMQGPQGNNTAVINIYKRDASTPNTPTYSSSDDPTYTFSTQTLSVVPAGWSQTIPPDNEDIVLWVSSIVAYDNTDTIDIDTSTTWSPPVKIAEKGMDGTSPHLCYLTNEVQSFSAGVTNATASTDLYAYEGSVEKSLQIKKVGTETTFVADTYKAVPNISWLEFKVSSTSSSNHPTITFKTVSPGPAESLSGQIAIEYLVSGETTNRLIYFTYSTTTKGENAKLLNIEPSGLLFKTADNGSTYTPDIITLTPRLQYTTFGNWYYNNTKIITSGSGSSTNLDGVSLNTSTNVLAISATSTLFNNNQSLTFEARNNDSTLKDFVTVTRLFDGVDGKGISSVTPLHYLVGPIIEGYKVGSNFYEDLNHIILITPVNNYFYYDKTSGQDYYYKYINNRYMLQTSIEPIAPSSHITSTSTDPNIWTVAVPKYVENGIYYICDEIAYDNNTYSWSTVVRDNIVTDAYIEINEEKGRIDIISEEVVNLEQKDENIGEAITLSKAAYVGSLHKLTIAPTAQSRAGSIHRLTPSNTLYPGASLYPRVMILTIQSENSDYNNKYQYYLDIDDLNYYSQDGDIAYDEFIYEDGKCWIIRRVQNNNGIISKLNVEVREPRADLIPVNNIITIDEQEISVRDAVVWIPLKTGISLKLLGANDYYSGTNNFKYNAFYLKDNVYTDSFTSNLDLVSQINLTPGTAEINASKIAKITANKIALEGYTTINGNFVIDNDGNMFANNGTFSGDIYLPDGGRVIGGEGLLTNLQYTSIGKLNGWGPLGFTTGASNNVVYADIVLDYFIPENFTPTEAYLTLYTTRVKTAYTSPTYTETTGIPKKLKLYHGNTNKTYDVLWMAGSEYSFIGDLSTNGVIDNAFGINEYNPDIANVGDVDCIQSIDLTNEIIQKSAQNNNCQLIVRTNISKPTIYSQAMAENTGMGRAILNIIGYISI